MPHSIETLHARLAHVEERLARLEKTEGAWRDTDSRLRVLETDAARQPMAQPETIPAIERLEERKKRGE